MRSIFSQLQAALTQRAVPSAGVPATPVPDKPKPPAAKSVPAPAVRVAAPTEPPGEARLVTELFRSPRSLVAAFIVAEVLAKPVALRDP